MRIVVDAMGSDNAPEVEVEGALQAAQEYDHEVILVGDEVAVKRELDKHGGANDKITVVHAPEKIEMHEPAALSVRRKRKSSIVLGLDLIKHDKADSFISAGNTGAVVCAATLSLRMLPGIERPGIAIAIPTMKGTTVIIDVGANIDPKPIHMFQYAVMADAYCRYILHKPSPKIGLLNVGEEESKGTEFIKEAHTLLSESKLNFIGNIEGRDIYVGNADIVLCDGFVGNVILKVSESVVDTLVKMIKNEIQSSVIATIGAALAGSAFASLKKKMDYAEYGGAPLLGIDGRVIISHGSSTAKAIKNAIRVAAEFKTQNVNRHILEELETV
ncbi:MAG: phosphate acyltransferase PlsX [Candidatus Omnitrophica bacterium]|nr:phosphate acyltransferase PlsX [Candidatus Omnitrophota bacterium]